MAQAIKGETAIRKPILLFIALRIGRKRQRLTPNLPIANASARHICRLTQLRGADAFAIGI